MRSLSWLLPLLVPPCCLLGCGGGGSDSGSGTVSATCDSTTLWAAHPATSGSTIPDNHSNGVSVTWDNQNCSLRSVSSATLEVCLNHPQATDLQWTLTPPSAQAMALNPPANWNSSGAACDAGQGRFQSMDILPTVSSAVTTQGLWRLHVRDTRLGDTGSLIQWRLVLRGTH